MFLIKDLSQDVFIMAISSPDYMKYLVFSTAFCNVRDKEAGLNEYSDSVIFIELISS